jgi:hypothetical protein
MHTPDFSAITAAERARGYSSRCQTCALPLISSMEFIGFPCPGGRASRSRPAIPPLELLECACGYTGPATVVPSAGHARGAWIALCPACRHAWII